MSAFNTKIIAAIAVLVLAGWAATVKAGPGCPDGQLRCFSGPDDDTGWCQSAMGGCPAYGEQTPVPSPNIMPQPWLPPLPCPQSHLQSVALTPGWNIISVPRTVKQHGFSADETSANFDIYVLDASSVSQWATMADLGQTEFVPLYGYFINNKTGQRQVLNLTYEENLSPEQRIMERTFSQTGWYSFGAANPDYSVSQCLLAEDRNNPSKILNSLAGKYDIVVSFSDSARGLENLDSARVDETWQTAVAADIDNLLDLRDMKGYAVYINEAGAKIIGTQNIAPAYNYCRPWLSAYTMYHGINFAYLPGKTGAEIGEFNANIRYGARERGINTQLSISEVVLRTADYFPFKNLRLKLQYNNGGAGIITDVIADPRPGREYRFAIDDEGQYILNSQNYSNVLVWVYGDLIPEAVATSAYSFITLEDIVAQARTSGEKTGRLVEQGGWPIQGQPISIISLADVGALTVGLAEDTPPAQNLSADSFKLVRLKFTADDVGDVVVERMKIAVETDNPAALSDISLYNETGDLLTYMDYSMSGCQYDGNENRIEGSCLTNIMDNNKQIGLEFLYSGLIVPRGSSLVVDVWGTINGQAMKVGDEIKVGIKPGEGWVRARGLINIEGAPFSINLPDDKLMIEGGADIWGNTMTVGAEVENNICPPAVFTPGNILGVAGWSKDFILRDNQVISFPDTNVKHSWVEGAAPYTIVSPRCYRSLTIARSYPNAVNYHSATYVVRGPGSGYHQLYVVEPNNTLAKISDGAAAVLYDDYYYAAKYISDRYWPNYVNRGEEIIEPIAHPGMLVKKDDKTYYVDFGKVLREVTPEGFAVNNFQERFVRSLPDSALAGLVVDERRKIEARLFPPFSEALPPPPPPPGPPPVGTLTVNKNAAFGDKTADVPTGVVNATEVKVASFVITAGAGESADISQVQLTETINTCIGTYLQNLTLRNAAGTQLGFTYPNPSASCAVANTYTFNISPTVNLAPGAQYVVDIYADLKAALAAAPLIQVSAVTASGHDSGTSIGMTGQAIALQDVVISAHGEMSIAVSADTPAATNGLLGATDQVIARYKLTASSAEAVNITKFVVSAIFPTANTTGTLKNIRLYDNASGAQIGSTVAAFSANEGIITIGTSTYAHVVFAGLNLQVPRGSTKVIDVKADFASFEDLGLATTGQAVAPVVLGTYYGSAGNNPITATGAASGSAITPTIDQTGTISIYAGAAGAYAASTTFYRAKLTTAWAADTPSGSGSPASAQIVAKVVVTNLANSGGYSATVNYMNFDLSTTIFEPAGDAATNALTVYKDSLATTAVGSTTFAAGQNITNTAMASWASPVEIASGASKTFSVTLDTSAAAPFKNLSVRVGPNDVNWTDGITANTAMGADLPLVYKTFFY